MTNQPTPSALTQTQKENLITIGVSLVWLVCLAYGIYYATSNLRASKAYCEMQLQQFKEICGFSTTPPCDDNS
jgi:hypothetical protein